MRKRSTAVLLHISSLPSPYGVGSMGQEAFRWIDWLEAAGVGCWQMLPLNPPGLGGSPYQSESTFAGAPELIDLGDLIARRLLTEAECRGQHWGDSIERVDWHAVSQGRERLLRLAFSRAGKLLLEQTEEFFRVRPWAEDYALFRAIKTQEHGAAFWDWPEGLAGREPSALAAFRTEHREELRFWGFTQTLFEQQFAVLRHYAAAHSILLIGDLPIYVSEDSVDVWANRALFELEPSGRPSRVAGVPPDAFTEDGQRWGNPLYRWEAIIRDDWRWWIERVRNAFSRFDLLRIDHFRAFDQFWSIDAADATAKEGRWEQGPGIALFDTLRYVLGELPVIAEDLGVLTDSVRMLLHRSGFPGMKVLQFAFTPGYESDYLPHRHIENSVCYTGTHDNDTLAGWFSALAPPTADYVRAYLSIPAGREVEGMIRAAWSSPCFLAVTTAQDLLGLGSEARMNEPGSVGEQNWSWRMRPSALTEQRAAWLRTLGKLYYR